MVVNYGLFLYDSLLFLFHTLLRWPVSVSIVNFKFISQYRIIILRVHLTHVQCKHLFMQIFPIKDCMIVVAHKTKKTLFWLNDHCSSLHHCFLSGIFISVPYYIFFRIAVTKGSTLKNELGIKNGIHRQKISVQAMDLVLFGPPKGTLYTTCCIYIILTVYMAEFIFQMTNH